MPRNSDRWITPAVVIVALLVLGALTALLIAAVAYLTVRGIDPDPMVKTVGALVAAVVTLANLAVTLASRQTVAKTERNTGVLASVVTEVADAMPKPVTTPPLEVGTARPLPRRRHAYPETGATPAASGS